MKKIALLIAVLLLGLGSGLNASRTYKKSHPLYKAQQKREAVFKARQALLEIEKANALAEQKAPTYIIQITTKDKSIVEKIQALLKDDKNVQIGVIVKEPKIEKISTP